MAVQTSPEHSRKKNARQLREGLDNHIRFVTGKALRKFGRIDSLAALSEILKDPETVRFPAELVFGLENLEEGEPAGIEETGDGFRIILHPAFEEREEDIIALALCMIPEINYGRIVNDRESALFASLLLGMEESVYHDRIEELRRVTRQSSS